MTVWLDGFDGQPNAIAIPGSGVPGVILGRDVMIYDYRPGFDVILRPDLMQSAWSSYQVAAPLTRVWIGDDPSSPTLTVQLQFPDEATALSVLVGCYA